MGLFSVSFQMRIPLSQEIAEAALRENCDCDTLHTRPPLFGKLDVAGMGFQITSPFLPCRRDPFLKIEGTLTPSGGGTCAKLRLTLPGRIWGLSLAALLLWTTIPVVCWGWAADARSRILLLWSGPLAAIALFVWNILRFRRDIRRTVAALRKIWEAGEPEPLP